MHMKTKRSYNLAFSTIDNSVWDRGMQGPCSKQDEY